MSCVSARQKIHEFLPQETPKKEYAVFDSSTIFMENV